MRARTAATRVRRTACAVGMLRRHAPAAQAARRRGWVGVGVEVRKGPSQTREPRRMRRLRARVHMRVRVRVFVRVGGCVRRACGSVRACVCVRVCA